MAYSEFTMETAETALGVVQVSARLFPNLVPTPLPGWATDLLARTRPLARVSEKSRGEFLVVPFLLACRAATGDAISILSGKRMDVDAARGLIGECDYILCDSPPMTTIRAPVLTIVEAKRDDIEGGYGQCVAQMVGARTFNERAGHRIPVYGSVTTGEVWQFFRLDGNELTVDTERYFLMDPASIFAALGVTVAAAVETLN